MGVPVGPKTHTTDVDLAVASIAWGFTLGFGFLTVWTAIKQSMRTHNRWKSLYLAMVWGEIFANLMFSIISYLFLMDVAQASVAILFAIIFFWCWQIQLLLQIIINRVNVIQPDRRKRYWLKYGVATIWLCINISGFCIWIPARLGIKSFHIVNFYWDRSEKVVYLVMDSLLNWYFMRLVRRTLVNRGSTKYDALVRFNMRIIVMSILMDFLLLGCMQLKNDLVYLQVHPLTFIVKLNIEITMASLVTKIAQDKNFEELSGSHDANGSSTYRMDISVGKGASRNDSVNHHGGVMVQRQVIVESEVIVGGEHSEDHDHHSDSSSKTAVAEDEAPLRDHGWGRKTGKNSGHGDIV